MTPSFLQISIDGKPLHEFSKGALLQQAEVRHELNQHSWVRLVIRQTLDERFPVEDSLGKELTVEAVDQQGESTGMFVGFILEGDIEYEVYHSFKVEILAVTNSYKMDLTPRQLYFQTGKLEDIAQELVDLHSLDLDTADLPGDEKQPYHVQWGQSDFEFLKKLADDHGCWLRPDKNGIHLVQGFDATREHTLKWSTEGGLLRFRVRGRLRPPKMNGAQYYSAEMKSQAYTDIQEEPEFYPDTSGQMIDAVKRESLNNLPPGYVYQRERARKFDMYEDMLKSESRRSIGGAITCWGKSRYGKLNAGDTLKVEGTIEGAGKYAITRVVHRWDRGGYLNEFWGTPWKKYTNPDPPPVRRWYGIVPGRVTDNNDPKGAGRVGVQFYWMPSDKKTHWMRTLTPHGGSDRGFYFLPEVGDEVIVAFQDGDVERPFILGSTWSGVDKAPTQDFWGGEFGNNDVKRIVTKSGHRIQIVDKEGKESISLATPNYLKITMLENADETGRPMIQLCSEQGDIFISAPDGRIHFKSKFFSREVG